MGRKILQSESLTVPHCPNILTFLMTRVCTRRSIRTLVDRRLEKNRTWDISSSTRGSQRRRSLVGFRRVEKSQDQERNSEDSEDLTDYGNRRRT